MSIYLSIRPFILEICQRGKVEDGDADQIWNLRATILKFGIVARISWPCAPEGKSRKFHFNLYEIRNKKSSVVAPLFFTILSILHEPLSLLNWSSGAKLNNKSQAC
jgi:hypothetical protein